MSDSSDDRLKTLERGVEALFAAEVANDVRAAIDFEALLENQPADEAVDVDRLADAIGRPVGRVLARRLVGTDGAAALAGRTIISEVSGRAVAETVRLAVDRVDTEAASETVVGVDERTPGPTVSDVVGIGGDGDVPLEEEPENADDTDPQGEEPGDDRGT